MINILRKLLLTQCKKMHSISYLLGNTKECKYMSVSDGM